MSFSAFVVVAVAIGIISTAPSSCTSSAIAGTLNPLLISSRPSSSRPVTSLMTSSPHHHLFQLALPNLVVRTHNDAMAQTYAPASRTRPVVPALPRDDNSEVAFDDDDQQDISMYEYEIEQLNDSIHKFQTLVMIEALYNTLYRREMQESIGATPTCPKDNHMDKVINMFMLSIPSLKANFVMVDNLLDHDDRDLVQNTFDDVLTMLPKVVDYMEVLLETGIADDENMNRTLSDTPELKRLIENLDVVQRLVMEKTAASYPSDPVADRDRRTLLIGVNQFLKPLQARALESSPPETTAHVDLESLSKRMMEFILSCLVLLTNNGGFV